MKKVLLVLFMILLLTGCGCARKEEAPKENNGEVIDAEVEGKKE